MLRRRDRSNDGGEHLATGYFRSFLISGGVMMSSREERRAAKQIAKIDRAQEVVGAKILVELYEETRPRDEVSRHQAGFIDDDARYLRRIEPVQVGHLQELCGLLDGYGVVNVRCIHDESKRRQIIDHAMRLLIEAGKIETDLNGTKFWLSHEAYQVEACRDDARRQARDERYAQKRRLRQQRNVSMGIAS